MGRLSTANVQDNEILKATDITDGFEAQIENMSCFMKTLLETRQDFVVGANNIVEKHSDTDNDWSLNIKPLLGVCFSTGKIFLETEKLIAACNVQPPVSGNERVDVVEVRGVLEEINTEQRAFIDFDTKDKILGFAYTAKEQRLEARVISNIANSISAPNHTEGWVKIAEIYIPGDATKISDCTIYNITSDVYGVENEDWTTEKTSTYNIGYISDVNNRFRQEHKADGSHKDGIIHSNNLDTGTSANQINGNVIPIGGITTVSGQTIASTTSLLTSIQTIVSKINDIYSAYLQNGKYNFDREVVIKGDSTSSYNTPHVKIGLNENNSAYIKIGDIVLLTVKNNGTITVKNEYAAINENDLVTKKYINELSNLINGLSTRVNNLETSLDQTKYANEVLSRYKIEDDYKFKAATTGNITLRGSQTIDGIDCQENDFVLVKNQTNKKENGLYQVTINQAGWDRIVDYGSPENLRDKLFIVLNGTQNKNKLFYCPIKNFIDEINYGEDNIEFVEHMATIEPKSQKIAMRDSNGHVKTEPSVNNNDCVNRSELATKNGAMAKAILDYVYPIGSLYWTSNNENPRDIFGFGTWTQIKDKFILAAGDSYVNGSTGGASTVTLAVNQIPTHQHGYTPSGSVSSSFSGNSGTISGGTHKHKISKWIGFWQLDRGSQDHPALTYDDDEPVQLQYPQETDTDGSHTHTFTPSGSVSSSFSGNRNNTETTGGNQSHNNMPPYIVKYCWERIG